MVSFELGEELRKMFFRLVTSVGGRASERKSEGLGFDSSWGLRIYSLSHTRDKTKNIFLKTFSVGLPKIRRVASTLLNREKEKEGEKGLIIN